MDGWMDRSMYGQMDGSWIDGWIFLSLKIQSRNFRNCLDRIEKSDAWTMDGWMDIVWLDDGWNDGGMDGGMDTWMDRWIK